MGAGFFLGVGVFASNGFFDSFGCLGVAFGGLVFSTFLTGSTEATFSFNVAFSFVSSLTAF
ncbi:hypothetical protein CS022_02830 [Veronia nyctiphanis]|uniref:Uncharacterized protein n=1 Tax=Veronia nyctiphanis TaxID=1278244 RepID=A0A4Q0YTG7_9GAMM|nr:hypothetical protein [Veronia nyctiphanis]RXJ74526.1 hypothetical protein CS022_02830 [Veronia nyctiphanis]